jgi:ElaB/YqjD/DUF883 family membrane-anchored ribosome-binding protein
MGATGIRLEKALWTNIAELRMAESRRRRYIWVTVSVAAALAVVVGLLIWLR